MSSGENVRAAVEVASDLVKIAKDSPDARAAGANAAKILKTLTGTVNTALLPLTALVYAGEKFDTYIRTRFGPKVGEQLSSVPPDDVIPPKPVIAGPTFQALLYAQDEPALEDLFASLLATAMNRNTADDAHPAFVEIIKQLDPSEAAILGLFLRAGRSAIVEFRGVQDEGYLPMGQHVVNLLDKDGQPIEHIYTESFIDNWIRLGLVEVDYTTNFKDENHYAWASQRPEYLRLIAEMPTGVNSVEIQQGLLRRTSFGRQFAESVGILKRTPSGSSTEPVSVENDPPKFA